MKSADAGFVFCTGEESLEADARRAARTNSPVLIMGESGTGRSALARFVHLQSRRAASSFVEIDCRTIGPDSVERHFTDAMRPGGGTVLLSGLERGVSALGVTLKHFLEDSTGRIGATPGAPAFSVSSSTPRLILEADQDLRSHIDRALWQRLVAWPPILLAPLRMQRRKKWQLLSLFAEHAARESGVEAPHFAHFLLYAHVVSFGWPGNAQQLRDYARHLVDIGSLAGRRLRLDTEFSFFDESETFAQDDLAEARTLAADSGTVYRNRRQRDFARALARLQGPGSGPLWRELSKASPNPEGRWSYPDVRWSDPHFAGADMCASVGQALDSALAQLGQWHDRIPARDLVFAPDRLPWLDEETVQRVVSGLEEVQLADRVAYAMVTGEVQSGPEFLEQVCEAVKRISPDVASSELERMGLVKAPRSATPRRRSPKKS